MQVVEEEIDEGAANLPEAHEVLPLGGLLRKLE